VGSLLDFAGPRLSKAYRRALFRICSSFLAASFYWRFNRVSKIHALISASIAATFYRHKVYGMEKLPQGGFLLVCNHAGFFDAPLLQMACPRPIRPMTRAEAARAQWVTPIFNLVEGDPIPISNDRCRKGISEAVEYIKEGGIVCIYPEGQLNQSGSILRLKKGYELIARMADCPIVPVWLDYPGDSIISGRFGSTVLRAAFRGHLRAQVAFGSPVSARSANRSMIRQALMELGEFCFRNRTEISKHVGLATLKSLKRRQFATAFVDGRNRKRVSRVDLLASSIALSRWLRRRCPGKRIGLALPECTLQIVGNIAVAFANKVPAILNSSDEPTVLRTIVDRFQIRSMISCSSFAKRLAGFLPETEVYDLDAVMAGLKLQILFWRIAAALLPPLLLKVLVGLSNDAAQSEAALFFTTRRSSVRERLVLSHVNIMGTIAQFRAMLNLKGNNVAIVPPSFSDPQALISRLWFPIIEGVQISCRSRPFDDSKSDLDAVDSEDCVLMGSPDYIRESLSSANSDLLEEITRVVAIQEDSWFKSREIFESEFGREVYAVHGLKRVAAAITMNLPDPAKQRSAESLQPSNHASSAGKLMPGLAAQIRNPRTGKVTSLYEPGMLWLKGATLFASVVDKPQDYFHSAKDGWFNTGKIARFDEDGFLFVNPEPRIATRTGLRSRSIQFSDVRL
jgi:acyl-[acyl-carrier-protein]-phospholipid O-acyltransferase / long-chain-fatty-acid--[acyl-carrier-protein] ligase